MTGPRGDRASLYPYATAGLIALDLVAAATLGRLFNTASVLGPILLATLGGHGVALLARYRRWPGALTAIAILAAGMLLAAWLVFPDTTIFGVPGPDTWTAATRALAEARRSFGVVIAPTAATPGFRLACVFVVATFAGIADWGAFRVGVTVESAVPAFTLFVFSSVLSTAQHRAPAALAFAAALVGWLVLHSAEFAAREKPWFSGTRASGSNAIMRGGAGLTAVAVLGAVIGLLLPFTQDPPAVAWRDRQTRPRTTVSPLVDIRARLVQRGESEVFTVDSPVRAYWRLTSLDLFDGQIWSSRSNYREVKGGRNIPDPAPIDAPPIMQRFSINTLASIWLPAAYVPTSVPTAPNISYDPASSSFITEEATSDGLIYDVASNVAIPSVELLRGQSSTIALRSQLKLPALDARVARLAGDITANARTPYDKALALQQFFRSGRFVYDLRVPPGHSGDALTNFLFNSRRGYCEQFAGSYAVLARAAGLPARVAVGFTAGEADPSVANRFHVREINAHAWPEVFLGQAGWVAFEPTPGRGVPNGESYTGVREAQANPSQPSAATTAAPTTVTPATTPTPAPPVTVPVPAQKHPWRTAIIVALTLVLAIAAYVGALPALAAFRRRRRWLAARTPEDQVSLAWAETGDALAAAGHRSVAGATPTQVAHGAADLVGDAAPRLERLAGAAVVAVYAPPRLRPDDVATVRADAEVVAAAARKTISTARRVRNAVDPRRLRR